MTNWSEIDWETWRANRPQGPQSDGHWLQEAIAGSNGRTTHAIDVADFRARLRKVGAYLPS